MGRQEGRESGTHLSPVTEVLLVRSSSLCQEDHFHSSHSVVVANSQTAKPNPSSFLRSHTGAQLAEGDR